jgi:hypothetical protein
MKVNVRPALYCENQEKGESMTNLGNVEGVNSLIPALRALRRRMFWSSFWMMVGARGLRSGLRFEGQAFDQERHALAAWRRRGT